MAIFDNMTKTVKKIPNKMNQKPKNRTDSFSFSTVSSSPSSPSLHSSSYLPSPSTPSHSPSLWPRTTFSESMMEENIQNAEPFILKWDPNGHSYTKFISIFKENHGEAKEFIKCVKELRQAMHFIVLKNSASEKLSLAQKLMQIAMKRLEKEFHLMLSENRQYLEPESVSSRSSWLSRSSTDTEDEQEKEQQQKQMPVSEIEQLSLTAISDLRLIADTMISCGYGKECIKVYKIIRKSTIDEALYLLGIKRYSSSHINKLMTTEDFDSSVQNWLNAVKIAVKTLFHGERFLCDQVFAASEAIRDSCFASVSKDGALNLFKFPEIVADSCKRQNRERIFRLMEMYESISDLTPDIESIFSYESVSTIKIRALSTLHKLGDSVRLILAEFESSIRRNSSKSVISGGGIHPLTDSVMTYISSLANYTGALNDVVGDDIQLPFPELYFDSSNSDENSPPAVSVKLAWIILVLLCKLDSKANLYNDVALSYLFLANNFHFVIEKVRRTNLKFILGEEWISIYEKKVKQYVAGYESTAWTKVICCLQENYSKVTPEMVKDCSRMLYSAFQEVYSKQKSWIVVDEKMRDEIKASIVNKLVAAYREFYEKYLVALSNEDRSMKVLTIFSPEKMEDNVLELFQGTAAVVLINSSTLLPPVSLSRPWRWLPSISVK